MKWWGWRWSPVIQNRPDGKADKLLPVERQYLVTLRDSSGDPEIVFSVLDDGTLFVNRPYVAIGEITYRPAASGMPEAREMDRLNRIEEAIAAQMQPYNGVSLGHTSGAGVYRMYFQLAENWPTAPLSIRLGIFKSHSQTLVVRSDPTGETYAQFLKPTPLEIESTCNRHVLDQLQAAGDPLTEPRNVRFAFVFSTIEDRAKLRLWAEANGLSVESDAEWTDDEGGLWLVVDRVQRLDPEPLAVWTSELKNVAETHGGIFDGWEVELKRGPRR